MTITGARQFYEEHEPKGEYVLVVSGADPQLKKEEQIRAFEEMTLEEHMQMYLDEGLDKKEAMKKVAADRGVSKRDIYKELLGEG